VTEMAFENTLQVLLFSRMAEQKIGMITNWDGYSCNLSIETQLFIENCDDN